MWGQLVEPCARRLRYFCAHVIAPWPAADPSALGQSGCAGANGFGQLRHCRLIASIDLKKITTAPPERMCMAFDQAGHQGRAAQVFPHCMRAAECFYFGQSANGEDPAFGNRQRLGARIGGIHCQDRAAEKNMICFRHGPAPS